MDHSSPDGHAIFSTPMLCKRNDDDARSGGDQWATDVSILDGDYRCRGLFESEPPDQRVASRKSERDGGEADSQTAEVGGGTDRDRPSTAHNTSGEEGGHTVRTGEGIGLCLLPRTASVEGFGSRNLDQDAAEAGGPVVSVRGVLYSRIPSSGGREVAVRRDHDLEIAAGQNMAIGLRAEGTQLPRACAEPTWGPDVLRDIQSTTEQVGVAHSDARDYLRDGDLVGGAHKRCVGETIHQLSLRLVGPQRRDAPPERLEQTRDCFVGGDPGGNTRADNGGLDADAQGGAPSLSPRLVATDGNGARSNDGRGADEQLLDVRLRLRGVKLTSVTTGSETQKGFIRGRRDSRGGKKRLLGSVGGVRPQLGGMEGGWEGGGGGAPRDVGAAKERGGNGSAGEVEGAAALERAAVTSAAETKAREPWQRCRVLACRNVRAERDELRAEVARVSAELRHLHKGLMLGGEARAWKASLVEVERKLEVEVREHQRSKRDRATLTSQLRAAEAERLQMSHERAALKAEVSVLRRRVAEQEIATSKREHENLVAERYRARQSKKEGDRLEREKLKLRESLEAERERAAREKVQAHQVLADAQTAAASRVREAELRAAEAAQAAGAAEAVAEEAKEDAALAREQLMAEEEAASVAEMEKNDAQWVAWNAERRAKRAQEKVVQLQARVDKVAPPTTNRTVDEWLQLSADARRKAAERERAHLLSFFNSHEWRLSDIAEVFNKLGWVAGLSETRAFFDIHYEKVRELMLRLEKEEYGKALGLFLHYEMHLTLPKILTLSQAACKVYKRSTDRYEAKILLHHKFLKGKAIQVPRVAPPSSVLQPLFKDIERELGVEAGEDGSLAFMSFTGVVQAILEQDVGKHNMPALSYFQGGAHPLPIVVSLDATGFGSQQINTICARNPYMSASAQQLRVFGVGSCGDDRDGSTRLLGVNLRIINDLIKLKLQEGEARCQLFNVNGIREKISPDVLVVTDVSALRHCEHVANSGWCGCSRDFALRQTPTKKPDTIAEMMELLKACHSHTCEERYVLSHTPLPGESIPRPCPAPGCTFAHDPLKAAEELAGLLTKEQEMRSDTTKAGKGAFSRWRMAHAHSHQNIQPGLYGQPMFEHDLADQIIDSLHLAELGLPKTCWKHGVLNNASDDARDKIDQKLKEWKHPLDTRRKEDGRCRAQKWFPGEKWATFCAGERGSPGGPIAIASLMVIVAEDMQLHGNCGKDLGPDTLEDSVATAAQAPRDDRSGGRGRQPAALGRGRVGRGRGAFTARRADAADAAVAGEVERDAPPPMLTFVPSAMEQAADAEDIAIIRKLYGSRSQTIINALLAFDAYFKWYYTFKASIPFLAPTRQRQEHALQCCRSAIDMHECFERVSINNHGSFLPHAAIFKVCRDILRIGDVWAVNLSPLELQNAETKRVASTGGARRIKVTSSGQAVMPMRGVSQGPAQLVRTKGYSTTMALSVLNNLLATQYLRRGDGIIATPESRRKERLFGACGSGRTKAVSTGVKHEKMLSGDNYEPREDTCIKAFVRLLHAITSPGNELL